MFDLQTLIALLATLFLFLTSVVLAYDKLQFRNYDLPLPQWFGLLLAGITFGTSTTLGSPLLVADQILRGFVRLEERRRIFEEEQRSNAEFLKLEVEKERLHELRMLELRKENARLAELESKLDIVLRSSSTNSTPAPSAEDS